jgi:hypothetical protein
MNLGELLEQLREGILNDRSDQTSGDSDFLWTDRTLIRYINEAQRRLAIRGLVIRDGSTAECCDVTLVEGQTLYPLHDSVIAVVSAKRTDVDYDLTRAGHAVLAGYRSPTDTWVDPLRYSTLQPGSPIAYSTDEEISPDDMDTMNTVTLRVYPEPDADAAGSTVRMRVIRKPLQDLCSANLSTVPEVPADHHLDMLDWAAYPAHGS